MARAAIVLLVSAASLSGCIVESRNARRFPLVVKDARTGRNLDNCLHLSILSRTHTGMKSVFGGSCGPGGWNTRYTIKDVDAAVLTSGNTVHQRAVVRVFIPLGLVWLTDYAYYSHAVVREGYVPVEIGVSKGTGPVVVRLQREHPGQDGSDRNVLFFAEQAARYLIPALRHSDPLRLRLIEIVAGQLARIARSSRNPAAATKARALLAELRKLAKPLPRAERRSPLPLPARAPSG